MKKNTYKQGILNFLLYPTKDGSLVAACRDLCLIREGSDRERLQYQIMADAQSYLVNVCKNKLGEHLLNQDLPKEILDEFNEYRRKVHNENFLKWVENIKEFLNKNHLGKHFVTSK